MFHSTLLVLVAWLQESIFRTRHLGFSTVLESSDNPEQCLKESFIPSSTYFFFAFSLSCHRSSNIRLPSRSSVEILDLSWDGSFTPAVFIRLFVPDIFHYNIGSLLFPEYFLKPGRFWLPLHLEDGNSVCQSLDPILLVRPKSICLVFLVLTETTSNLPYICLFNPSDSHHNFFLVGWLSKTKCSGNTETNNREHSGRKAVI